MIPVLTHDITTLFLAFNGKHSQTAIADFRSSFPRPASSRYADGRKTIVGEYNMLHM